MSSAPIVWDESFSVGVPMLDAHHRHLADLINRLAGCIGQTDHSEAVDDILGELIRYAMVHFEHEERLMQEHGYPHFEAHRAHHLNFCEVVAETSYGATLGVISVGELLAYLTRWWQHHIRHDDMQFKPYLAA